VVGNTLNHYKIVSKLGTGGMGEVYVAEDTKLNRHVALKILPPELAEKPERLERFRREAQAVAALNHPNIVTIHSVEEAGQQAGGTPALAAPVAGDPEGVQGMPAEGPFHFITMELVEGKTLDEAIPRKGFPLSRFFQIAIPVADAISAAHEKGITHRDLKPSNIMIGEDGRVKVLDFGLALFEEGPLEAAATQASERLTGEGQILGTTAYMSPEQAEGKPADHRSDLFSLGVVLYEMATGERPFQGDTQISLITSILRDTPISITEVRRTYPRHLGRIISRCLEKNPGRRYHSAIDLRNDLESLRDEVGAVDGSVSGVSHSGAAGAAGLPGSPNWLVYAAATVAILAALASSFWAYRHFTTAEVGGFGATGASAPDERPSLAVLYFENVSGKQDLDWLRTGLTEMLVTDLSQSPDLRVLGTDSIYEILSEAGADQQGISAATVRAMAEQAQIENVVLGSFMQAGDTIRITARLQDPATGEVLASEQVEGEGESSIFSMVDDLTRRLRMRLSLAPAPAEVLDRDLGDVTTGSVAAYRYFAEANRLHVEGNVLASIPLFEQALEIDPSFALAMAKLSIVYSNIFDLDRSLAYAEQALEHVDRLTLRERLYIEGAYNSLRPSTRRDSIRAYERLVELYPNFSAARNNLAAGYMTVGRYQEALGLLEALADERDDFQGVYGNLANVYGYLGDLDKARETLDLAVAYFPENGTSHRNLGHFLVRVGDFEAAQQELARAAALSPGDPIVTGATSELHIQRGEFSEAEEAAEGLVALPIPAAVAWGTQLEAVALLSRGKLGEATASFERLVDAIPSGAFKAMAQTQLASLALEQGDPERGLLLAEEALEEAGEFEVYLSARFWAALAKQRLEREREATSDMADLVDRLADLPGRLIRVEEHLYPGLLDLERGRMGPAVAALREAEQQLAAHADVYGPDRSFHAPVWFALGSALLASGDEEAALERFHRIAESCAERINWPLQYVRSLFFLGKIHAQRGDEEQARDYLQLFLDHWGDGEIDRNRVAEARELLAGL
jgi:serine/threonine protein kinase/tetratricopeptide (TPR) repeat protein